ncbi:MAG TPA: hypothetical protein VNI02_13555 [Blastocatellia bacterium]|jgi:hypothetical protein|nr:hypothetical protein [Blastocatellia bacterium]
MDKEKPCNKPHSSIPEAIRHAEEGLGCRQMPLQPYWGTTKENLGLIVGFQLNNRKRWRLDYDDKKGAHVNEENFDAPISQQKVVHKINGIGSIAGDLQVRLQWRKWTSGAFDLPEKVKEEIEFQRTSGKK